MGQLKDMYWEIWEEREHISELSGEPLLPPSHCQFIWQFLHVLPKGTYPKYKYNKNNIILALPSEHEKQEQYETFNKKFAELRQEYYETYYGKTYPDT